MKNINLSARFAAARSSQRALWLLNRLLWTGIPFNRPHRLTIREIGGNYAEVWIPFRRKNKNHLNGLHACVLATGAEYVSGLVLLQALDASEYRLIMRKMEIVYHYQGKTDAFARYELDLAKLKAEVEEVLRRSPSVDLPTEVEVVDSGGELLCTATVHWQVKPWNKVKTKA